MSEWERERETWPWLEPGPCSIITSTIQLRYCREREKVTKRDINEWEKGGNERKHRRQG